MMLQKILPFLLGLLPKESRLAMMRKLASVPHICDDPGFRIKVANTKDELEQAYILLHDCYVGTKLMEADPSGMRCNLYTFLPETTTIIVKYNSEIVGTVTLIIDNRLGLPSDKEFGLENANLRKQGKRLIEVSALAVAKKFQKTNHSVSLMLMKYLYMYAHLLDADCLVCTVHPRAQEFYEAIWGFTQRGAVIQYPFVNGALAVHLNLELTHKMALLQVARFGTTDLHKSLPLWVLDEDPRFEYPFRRVGQLLDPVLTPELLRYFFVKKTNLFNNLTNQQKSIFVDIYAHFFGAESVAQFSSSLTGNALLDRKFRLQVKIPAAIYFNNHFEICKIADISSEGAYITIPEHLNIKTNDKLEVNFKIGRSSFKVAAKIVWINNEKSTTTPYGAGIEFDQSQPGIGAEAQTFKYRKKIS